MTDVAALRRRRAPLVGLGLVALFVGLWGGLIRLGLVIPTVAADAGPQHGVLMSLGFLGALVSLERAVALGKGWAYGAPFGAGVGCLAIVFGAPGAIGPTLVCFGGFVLAAAHLVLQFKQPSAHNVVMGIGALAWCAAGVDWVAGADIALFVPLLAGFLVLTIVGERLELTRAAHRSRQARLLLLLAIGVFVVGLAVSMHAERLGIRIAGVGLFAQALWLARYDIATRTVRLGGITRYMASAFLAGYVWLACAGVLWTVDAALYAGSAYDASLHAVFLGFVMSMVFAHAPVIVPAVLRVRLPYKRGFYVQLVLLHVALAVRLIGGDLLGNNASWQWGGVGNEAAILLFLLTTALAVRGAMRRSPRPVRSLPRLHLVRPRQGSISRDGVRGSRAS
jgi:hypothetical protein